MFYPLSNTAGYSYQPSTFVDILRWRAQHQPDQTAYVFLIDGETDESRVSYSALHSRAKTIAGRLQTFCSNGERALLLYPPGLDFIAAFYGCLYAGILAVPTYPAHNTRNLSRIHTLAVEARINVVLTTSKMRSLMEPHFNQSDDLAGMQWLSSDQVGEATAELWQLPSLDSDSLAFIQYTSGSTTAPRGVMLSHGNLLHNSALIHQCFQITSQSQGMLWLPPYHDMGLIGGILQPMYGGFPITLISHLHFLQNPFRWLQTISQRKVTSSGGPNFAYDLCVDRITPEQRNSLDLSSWELAFIGADHIYAETMDRFVETFGPCGFHRNAFYPCYGLAEVTLIVTGGDKNAGPKVRTYRQSEIEQNRAVEAPPQKTDAVTLVGCGKNLEQQITLIVDPETLRVCAPGQIGEIWVAGPSVAKGYWNRPEETKRTFRAYRAETGEGPFLRTGDLGFLKDGELFVTGRLKDLIIIGGRNFYPQDLEQTVEESHPALRPGCGAVVSFEKDRREHLVVIYEVKRRYWRQNIKTEVIAAIRKTLAEHFDLHIHAAVLIKPGSIPKTTSGKIRRHRCKEAFLEGTLLEMKEQNAPQRAQQNAE